jgi:hypothetical protein
MHTMENFLLIIIVFLILILMSFILFYFYTQQSLRDISNRLNTLQPSDANKRSPETIRRERAYCHDQLVVLEAELSTSRRESLTTEELESIDRARKTIKACIEELKHSGDWIGLPFDFEWTEMLARLPNVNTLYRNAEQQATAPEGAEAAPSALGLDKR